MKILLLGNGTSRLYYQDFISKWKDPIWGCNLAFKEDIKFDLIGTVHEWVAEEAKQYGFKGEVLTPKTFKKYYGYSSGSELISEAIARGYKQLYLLGYDSIEDGNECLYTGTVVISNFKNQIEYHKKNFNLKMEKIADNFYLLEKQNESL